MSTTAAKAIYSHLHPTPSWELADHAVPTGREETWRFSPLRTFAPLFELATAEFTDWQFDHCCDKVKVSKIDLASAKELSWDPPVDRVAAKAAELAGGAQLVEIAPEAEPKNPLVFKIDGAGKALCAHLIVKIGHHAKVTLIFNQVGLAQIASKIEIHADDEANVDVVSIQDWAADAVHGGQFSVRVGRNAKVRTIQGSIGAGNVRLVERAEYVGTGGQLEQLGLYFVRAGQHVEHRLFIDHNAPHTDSHVDYRGALQGKGAHSVWIGDVLIRAIAQDIETYETNKNLMLTEGCQADSVPNLEIETGEIRGAGHSSSTGRFDEDQLFYLRSRGVPEEQARRLIVEGFFLDIIHRIGEPDIEARLVAALNEQLSNVEGMVHESLLSDQVDEDE